MMPHYSDKTLIHALNNPDLDSLDPEQRSKAVTRLRFEIDDLRKRIEFPEIEQTTNKGEML